MAGGVASRAGLDETRRQAIQIVDVVAGGERIA